MAEAAAAVRAQRFELVDAEGNVRARLALQEDGTPGLCLCDAKGKMRAGLLLNREGVPQLCVWAESGALRATLGFGTEWKTELVLTDRNQQVIWSAGADRRL